MVRTGHDNVFPLFCEAAGVHAFDAAAGHVGTSHTVGLPQTVLGSVREFSVRRCEQDRVPERDMYNMLRQYTYLQGT